MADEKRNLKVHTVIYSDGDKDDLFLQTDCEINGTKDDYTILYNDTSGDMGKEETLLHISSGKKVTVNRKGEHKSFIILEKDIRHKALHKTPQGDFSLGVLCEDIKSDFEKGSLFFSYSTDIEQTPVGKIEFTFDFSKSKEK